MPHAVGLERLVTLIAVAMHMHCRTALKSGLAIDGLSGFFMGCVFILASMPVYFAQQAGK